VRKPVVLVYEHSPLARIARLSLDSHRGRIAALLRATECRYCQALRRPRTAFMAKLYSWGTSRSKMALFLFEPNQLKSLQAVQNMVQAWHGTYAGGWICVYL
jgi:hypothetical protein